MTRGKGDSPFDDVTNSSSEESETVEKDKTNDTTAEKQQESDTEEKTQPSNTESDETQSEETSDVKDSRSDEEQESDSKKKSTTPDSDSNRTIDRNEPSFPFADAKRMSFFPYKETWEEYDETKFEIKVTLRREHDIRDVDEREFHEAIMQLVLDEFTAEDIAEKIVNMRIFD